MGRVIAMAGKGGTGKTTIASLIVRIITEKRLGSVLAVDADPNSNLAEALGLQAKESIGGILDDISIHPQVVPLNMGKDAYIEYRVHAAIAEGEGFDVLTMGRPEGPGCYCYVNNALRKTMEGLIKDYDFVIIDNEAGLEHLSRRTTRHADSLVVVSDASRVGLKAAKRITELTRELGIKISRQLLIINRSKKLGANLGVEDLNLTYLGSIDSDEEIELNSLNGGSLMNLSENNRSIAALRKLGEEIWHFN